MVGAVREADFWRLLVRVRDLRVRRRLRGLVDARRLERQAAVAVTVRLAALEQHAQERLSVLAFCRRDLHARARWQATLRGHDAGVSILQQQLSDARRAHAAARNAADEALRTWQVERARHEDAKDRWRTSVARVGASGEPDGG